MKNFIFFWAAMTFVPLYAQKVQMAVAPETGGIFNITIAGDPLDMNWIVSPDGRQYEWIGREWAWGLGSVRLDNGEPMTWTVADRIDQTGSVYYIDGRVELDVTRTYLGDDLVERYVFKNVSSKSVFLNEMEINTPFNDNYPDAATCVSQRCHAHIWAGGGKCCLCVCFTYGRSGAPSGADAYPWQFGRICH